MSLIVLFAFVAMLLQASVGHYFKTCWRPGHVVHSSLDHLLFFLSLT